MREIKFRCWRDGYMCKYYDRWYFVEDGIYFEEKDADPDKIGLGNPILMQYTGLKDKNGVEIYEADIIDGSRVVIEPHGTGLRDKENRWQGQIAHRTTEFEVIGNIYQNPELLK